MIYLERPKNFVSEMGVVACYVQHDNKFIVLQRQLHKSHGGKWGLPAGKVDSGESPDEAVIREIFEETGMVIQVGQLQVLSTLFVQHEGHDFTYHSFRVTLSVLPQIILSKSEHQAYTWVTPRESINMDLVHDLRECNKLFFSL